MVQNRFTTLQKIRPYGIVDIFRGLSSLWIVMFHACVYFLFADGGQNAGQVYFWPYLISIHGQLFGVTAFFVISGYCITNAAYNTLVSGKGVMDYAWARVWRIYPPYYIACVVVLAVELVTLPGQTLDFLPMGKPLFWLANFLMLQTEFNQHLILYVAWTLCYEVLFYTAIGTFLALAKYLAPSSLHHGTTIVWLGIVGLTFFSLLAVGLHPDHLTFPLDKAYQFGLGGLLFFSFLPGTSGPGKWKAQGLFFASCVAILLVGWFSDDGGFMVDTLRIGSVRDHCYITVAIALALKALRPLDRAIMKSPAVGPFVWLGKISYSLYLIHGLVAGIVCEEVSVLGFDHHWYWVSYLAQIVASLVFGYLFYYFVERHFLSSRARMARK